MDRPDSQGKVMGSWRGHGGQGGVMGVMGVKV